MSKLQYDHSGVGPRSYTQYTMLNNLCGGQSQLGVTSAAPVYQPYNVDPMMQSVPVYKGTNYAEAPYMNPLLFCGGCGGPYCNANKGYHWPVDAAGNPLAEATYNAAGGVVSGYSPMSMVKKDGPDSRINMTCANNNSCMTNGIMRQAPRK